MDLKLTNTSTLRIKRVIRSEQAIVTTDCFTGIITVLADINGGTLPSYQFGVTNPAESKELSFEYNSTPFVPPREAAIGFDDPFPDDLSINAFFEGLGYDQARIEQSLDFFDLRRVSYLPCAQLPPTSKRQLLLLKGLNSESPVLFLNDPFQPFNGRWREYFAEALLKELLEKDRILVMMNLSFMPQTWVVDERVRSVDVGIEGERAIQRARDQKARDQKLKEQKAKEQALKEQSQREERESQISADIATLTAQAEGSLPGTEGQPSDTSQLDERNKVIPVFQPLYYAYKETVDFIFEPLANLTRLIRGYSGVFAVSICCFLLLVMGFVMLPGLSEQRAKLREIAGKFTYEWKDVKNYAVNAVDTNKTTANSTTTNPTSLNPERESSLVVEDNIVVDDTIENVIEEAPLSEDSREPEVVEDSTLLTTTSINSPDTEISTSTTWEISSWDLSSLAPALTIESPRYEMSPMLKMWLLAPENQPINQSTEFLEENPVLCTESDCSTFTEK